MKGSLSSMLTARRPIRPLRRSRKRFGVTPSIVIKTRRGYHHHFRLAAGTFAKPDLHSTVEFPVRIDVRAGKNSVVLTPSQDKLVIRLEAAHRDELVQVNQTSMPCFTTMAVPHRDRWPTNPKNDQPRQYIGNPSPRCRTHRS